MNTGDEIVLGRGRDDSRSGTRDSIEEAEAAVTRSVRLHKSVRRSLSGGHWKSRP